jgi:hypothetical protein
MGVIDMPGVYQSSVVESLSKAAEHLAMIQRAAKEAGKQAQQEKQQQGGSK